jgi:Predicted transcriptional regulator with C-terminal CBS domains
MKSNLPHAFSKAIKSLRIKKGLSQEGLADIAGLDRTYISGIERETRNPTIKSIQKIIIALDESDSDFLELVREHLNG